MNNNENLKFMSLDILKSVLIGLVFALVFTLLFALMVRYLSLDDNVILPMNIAIKILSIFCGVLIGFKHKNNGISKGMLTGLILMLLTYFLFATLSGFENAKFNIIDLITMPVMGAISGIIAVNISSRSHRRRPAKMKRMR